MPRGMPRALGKERVAMGIGVLARIHASVAQRPDVEEEATRLLVQMLQQQEGLPLMEDLFAELELTICSRQDGAEPLPIDLGPAQVQKSGAQPA
jgi:hypothetical protein